MLIFFTNTCLVEFEVIYLALFLLFLVIDSFEWFWMASLHKNIQLMLEFLKAPSLILHFSYNTLMTFLMMLCDIAIYADDDTFYSKCDQASDLWQQFELASELKSDVQDTVDLGKKWLVDFKAGKSQLVSLDLYLYKSSICPCIGWNCKTSYKNKYAGLLVLQLVFLLNPWLNVKMRPA